ncbi:MAG: hypothetical protein O8C66_11510 [Candidatus Methanoperedens sp.]|nr:hypothetical protein [Candidatus Methanoperedens sp.]MCZ7371128.1 hypothetical protein [Candidatus Methanoperedens sp.]
MNGELRERLGKLDKNYDGKAFREIISQIKRERINDNGLLVLVENISLKRFKETVSFTISVPVGNLLEAVLTIATLVLAFQINSNWMLYISALVLMATLHSLSHYITGALAGIRFSHYYLNGPARIEPTLRIDFSSYLKAPGKKRALMHLSGVVGTVAAPLIVAVIALDKGASVAAVNLFYLFLLLIVFELLTSTKIGDLMKAKREYGYR